MHDDHDQRVWLLEPYSLLALAQIAEYELPVNSQFTVAHHRRTAS